MPDGFPSGCPFWLMSSASRTWCRQARSARLLCLAGPMFLCPDLVHRLVQVLGHMVAIERNQGFPVLELSLTALMYGSHMSIEMLSKAFKSAVSCVLNHAPRVPAFRSWRTSKTVFSSLSRSAGHVLRDASETTSRQPRSPVVTISSASQALGAPLVPGCRQLRPSSGRTWSRLR